jgi:hypothetical protein
MGSGRLNKSIDRIGLIKENNLGSRMQIIEYKDSHNITVKFLDHENSVTTQWINFQKGNVRNVYDKSIFGVGYIGEGNYKTIQKNRKATPQYRTWHSMIQRCYSKKYHKRQPTYKDCYVCDDWHNFQTFARWFDQNYYEIYGEQMALDKDILIKGNKVYSPDTCIFVPRRINSLFIKCNESRGKLPIGITYNKHNKKYQATCYNTDSKVKNTTIGYYDSPEDAFQDYKIFKENVIKSTADKYKNDIPEKLYTALYNYIVEIND